jgi:hypothetical protein
VNGGERADKKICHVDLGETFGSRKSLIIRSTELFCAGILHRGASFLPPLSPYSK